MAAVTVLILLAASDYVQTMWFHWTRAILLRKAIVKNLIDLWLHGNNASKLDKSDIYAQNPDQRIHQDTRQLADSTTGLVVGFIQSTILLFSFIGILWNVSTGFAGTSFARRLKQVVRRRLAEKFAIAWWNQQHLVVQSHCKMAHSIDWAQPGHRPLPAW